MVTQTVRILRCFYFKKKALQPGDIVDLPIPLVKECLSVKRVEVYEKKPMPLPEITKEVETIEPMEDTKIKKGGKKNAWESG